MSAKWSHLALQGLHICVYLERGHCETQQSYGKDGHTHFSLKINFQINIVLGWGGVEKHVTIKTTG